jgi:hypothetical protein
VKLPVVKGIIDRRILVNYRVESAVLGGLLPAPFRPKLVRGTAMAGICLIRLRQVRPAFLPAWLGISSENAAHRAAVEWTENGKVREGVYVRRRDTSSRLNALTGGRVFPGIHHHGAFLVKEMADRFELDLRSDDGETRVSVRATLAPDIPDSSVFESLDVASDFFRTGSLGYSATPDPSRFQGLELRCRSWRVEPLLVESVRSSFFEDRSLFPEGTVELDCALLMRDIEHEWHGKEDLCCAAGSTAEKPVLRQHGS